MHITPGETIKSRIRGIYYGWVIVAASLLIITLLWGIRYSFGVFFKALQSEFDLSRAATSGIFSAQMLMIAITGILSGWALNRYGPRLIVSLMGIVTVAGLLVTSQTHALWQVFLSYSVLLSIGIGGCLPVLVAITSRWFDRKRGIAIGLVTSGGGLGTLAVVPFSAYLISNLDWRASYMVMALVALLVIPLAMSLRRDPGEMGALPDGAKRSDFSHAPASGKEPLQPGLSLSAALRTRNLWLLLFSWLSIALSISLISTHIVPHATDIGITAISASIILSLSGGVQTLTRLVVGRVSDRIGRKAPGVICAALGAVAMLWLTRSQELWMFYIFAIMFGIAWGGAGVTNVTLASELFGNRSLGIILGTLEAAVAAGQAIGSALGGAIFDLTGSYVVAFIIGAGGMLTVALCIALTRRVAPAEAILAVSGQK